MNTQRIQEGQSDYLAMISPPDFENLSSPHNYVNDMPVNSLQSPEASGYMFMKPANIFSPREADDNVFKFDINKPNNENDPTSPELLPMLQLQYDSEVDSPTFIPKSFSNPSYSIPPTVTEPTKNNILKSTDNYVNMPQNKSAFKNDVKKDKIVNSQDKPYVNNSTIDWERVKA